MPRALLVTLCCAASLVMAQTPDSLAKERCANRLSRGLQGVRAKTALLAASDPQAVAETLLDKDFVDRFSAYVNGKLHPNHSTRPDENTPAQRLQRVLTLDRPWKELFIGRWDIGPSVAQPITPNENATGYFTDPGWVLRYAGNEENGYRLVSAYRILQNLLGVTLTAATNNATGENDSVGRQRPECRGCHWEGPYPLDLVARVLSKKTTTGALKFVPPSEGPQPLFGRSLENERQLIEALVETDHFLFNSCRLAFEYVYGRPESTCEAPVFDACMTSLRATGSIKKAVLAIVQHPEFCQ